MSDQITEPTVHLCWNDFAIRGAVHALRMAHLDTMADDMEAQLKPAVEEPQEFGSLIRAPWSGKSLLWAKTARNSWWSESGIATTWSELTDVEVLRVGIGQPLAPWETELQRDQEVREVATAVLSALRQQDGSPKPSRFCTISQNCRMADGHAGGCRP